ncbi:phosphoribosylamine--glycine ligase [Vampirovibrio chlorellavorus]|uniref:phosphoribosylamine--glycine ligase n=1 Tax=Vampirovibrio chlorellavorus TaxID=758823 RepID=UPI0026F1A884|nr:phosphoribosylamine--glycine ligase [Vampirovibrio chlorellavorus]
MKILLIGNGGREHAIAWTLSQSPHQPQLYFAQGNPGMQELGQRLDIEPTDIQGLLIFAEREGIDLTIVGPELPLSLGIVDRFQEKGLAIFGPTQAGAQLESSKAFAKALMAKANIPTAGYRFCQTQPEALQALQEFTAPYVIKEDGLAAGKGVTIAQARAEAEQAIAQAFQKEMPVVIEEFMQGQELSILAFCDGQTILPCIAAQDYKKVGENNTGPNTGGMGAYAPVPLATPALIATVQQTVLEPALKALKAEGIDYKGILYAGLMITPDGAAKVVEFNARFGDPETQVVLPLLADDLVELMLATVNGELHRYAPTGIRFKPGQWAMTVVLTAGGYPGDYPTGTPIFFPQYLNNDVHIFHAGTRVLPDQSKVTAGGRVLNVTGIAENLEEARRKAYEIAGKIRFEGKYYRRDIAAEPAMALSR